MEKKKKEKKETYLKYSIHLEAKKCKIYIKQSGQPTAPPKKNP